MEKEEIEREFAGVVEAQPRVLYFDTAGRSAQPVSVEKVGVQALQAKSRPWAKSFPPSEAEVQRMRALFAQLIDAPHGPDDIAFCPSTGFAMTMAVQNLVAAGAIRADSSILMIDKEMGSVVYPWQRACAVTGARLKIVPRPDWTDPAASWSASILAALDSSVSVLALPAVHWCDGSLIDLERIADALQRMDEQQRPLLVIDGTQSVGALPLSVRRLQPAFLACSVHKWLLCPYGMSLVYLHPRFHSSWQPLDQHERAREGSHDPAWDEVVFMSSSGYPPNFFAGARRLDSGGRPNPILVPMVVAALELLNRWTVGAVHQRLQQLQTLMIAKIQQIPFDTFAVPPPALRGGHFVGIRLNGSGEGRGGATDFTLQDIQRALHERNIHASIRGEALRLSPYLFSSVADINVLHAILHQLVVRHRADEGGSGVVTRVLLTGATGWLAQIVFRSLISCPALFDDTHCCEVYAATHSASVSASSGGLPWVLPGYQVRMDLQSEESVRQAVRQVRPDVVLHLAAISSPLECHKNPASAQAINCPHSLVQAVSELVPNCLFIFASTDMVYGGESAPYRVGDAARPANIYGATKLAFEELVLKRLPHGVVLRLSNMIGPPFVYQPGGEKFLQFLHTSLRQRKLIGLKSDELRSFVSVEDVARIVTELIQRHRRGQKPCSSDARRVLNVGGPRGLSRLELARVLSQALNVPLGVLPSADSPIPAVAGGGQEASVQAWHVFEMQSGAAACSHSDAAEKATFEQLARAPLVSPRDISMNVAATEEEFGMRMTPLEDCIVNFTEVY